MAGLPKEIYIVVAEHDGVFEGPIAFESKNFDFESAKEFKARIESQHQGRMEIYKATKIDDPIRSVRVSDEIKYDFETWWYNEGSGARQQPEEDVEEFVARMTEIAWSNGAYKEKNR